MKTLVIGLGNPILTDDGIGVRVAQEVRASLPKIANVEVIEVSVGGLKLMESMIGYDYVIIIDAIQNSDREPGTIYPITLDDLKAVSPTQHSASAHDVNLVTALEMGKRLGLPLPRDITIFAIEVENTIDFGENLTPIIAAAIPQATAAVLEKIKPNTQEEGLWSHPN